MELLEIESGSGQSVLDVSHNGLLEGLLIVGLVAIHQIPQLHSDIGRLLQTVGELHFFTIDKNMQIKIRY